MKKKKKNKINLGWMVDGKRRHPGRQGKLASLS
jgi:hypothetical protein